MDGSSTDTSWQHYSMSEKQLIFVSSWALSSLCSLLPARSLLPCRSHLTPTRGRIARCVSWPGTATVSGCPSDWTPLSGCSTPTPSSTFRTLTLNPTSARCWVGSTYIPSPWSATTSKNPQLRFHFQCVLCYQERGNWASHLWGSPLSWCRVIVCGLAQEMGWSFPFLWQIVSPTVSPYLEALPNFISSIS